MLMIKFGNEGAETIVSRNETIKLDNPESAGIFF